MALAAHERQQPSSPPPSATNGLTLNLSSNNPFRNRSTASPSPRSADANRTQFPIPGSATMSKNPFLDPSEGANNTATTTTGAVVNGGSNYNSSRTEVPDDIFKDLALLDKPNSNTTPPLRGPPPRAGTLPIQSNDRRDKPTRPPRAPDSPQKRVDRPALHGRRASESSMMDGEKRRDRADRDHSERAPRTESEERRRRERRKEREERHRREKERVRAGGKKPRPGLDIIDKLDVTGIYGEGLFHHDGPFDACNPHRNAKRDRRAPMQAFPEGSANMALGGAGPLNSRIDLDKFHGRGVEGFSEYGATRKTNNNAVNIGPTFVNPTDRIEQVHGEESHGLGTSTFLEGAPASRSALQRRESEDQTLLAEREANGMGGGGGAAGLARKKSLAQRLRGMSGTRRAPGDLRSPEPRYGANTNNTAAGITLVDGAGHSPPINKSIPAGAAGGIYTRENETNPFDTEYDDAFEKKGAQIRIAEQQETPSATMGTGMAANVGRARAPSSPQRNGLIRSVTADSGVVKGAGGGGEGGSGGGGFLSRMKSLKGGRSVRRERREEGS